MYLLYKLTVGLLTLLGLIALGMLAAAATLVSLFFVYIIMPICLAIGFGATLVLELAKRQKAATVH